MYGALHSTLFGFSDDDLFLFWAAGGRLDLFADRPPAHGDVADALHTLRELHTLRLQLEPHAMVVELIARTRTAELVAAGSRGAAQATADLEKLTERARAFAGAGGGGLGGFLHWAAEAGDAAGEQGSPVDDEGDVITLMTIRKAKGLEAPIVVLMGGALPGRSGPSGEPLVDRAGRRLCVRPRASLPGAAAQAVEPPSCRAVVDPDTLLARCRPQGAAYAVATEAVLGHGAVLEVVFVPARAGGVPVVVPVDDGLRSLARREVGAAAREGRALADDELARSG